GSTAEEVPSDSRRLPFETKPPADVRPAARCHRSLAGFRAVLAPPWKQRRWEIGRRTSFPMRAGRDRPRIGIRCDHLAIEMPGRVTEQRDDDRKADEERQRAQ